MMRDGMKIFGKLDAADVPLLTLRSESGLVAELIPYGARLVRFLVPDRDGRLVDVVLGHEDLDGYLYLSNYSGATCGRYANRIRQGRFVLDTVEVQLDRNEGANHLHGGSAGLDRQVWHIEDHGPMHARFTTVSNAGDMGYPGRLEVETTYRLAGNALEIEMTARTDAPTIINLVNHAFFNLGRQGDVLDHVLEIPADFYTPVTDDLLTTGEVRPVAGTGFDFRQPRSLRAAMVGHSGLSAGWDHNWCLRGPAPGDALHLAARLYAPDTGLAMAITTNQPGVQIYSCGQMQTPISGKDGASYGQFAGLTFETQVFPCAPNHLHFPSCRLDPGQVYSHLMRLEFATI
jgi:aldose 1-epimerase